MFFDEQVVILKAGNGGNGCMSFRRERFIPKGGPNGGDGGKGGDVILVCDPNLADLTRYHYKPNWSAKDGGHGKGSLQTGPQGEDCILPIPPGTVIFDEETGEMLGELIEKDQRICILKGGHGGKGNTHFKSSTNRSPRQTTPGIISETRRFKFVLKAIADIGLVGYPNAGKSSLINLLTNAHPKIAPYPFTTKMPSVGILEYPEHYKRVRIADIPGLIEGASENKGLGHRFLRHIERCKVILILLDMAGSDERSPLEDYKSLQKELGAYSPALLEKPHLIVANKIDLPPAATYLKSFKKTFPKRPVIEISCLEKQGLDLLKNHMLEWAELP